MPIQLAQCRFPGLAISNTEISVYFSNKTYVSNFIKQHSETVTVWNYQNADCSLRKKLLCVIYYNFRHNFAPSCELHISVKYRTAPCLPTRQSTATDSEPNAFPMSSSTGELKMKVAKRQCRFLLKPCNNVCVEHSQLQLSTFRVTTVQILVGRIRFAESGLDSVKLSAQIQIRIRKSSFQVHSLAKPKVLSSRMT